MKILIVAATPMEVNPLIDQLKEVRQSETGISGMLYNCSIDVLTTGVGMVATALYTATTLNDDYDLAINMGICGSFNKNIELGMVVNVYEDRFSEMGAEDGDNFLSLEDLKLSGFTIVKNESGAIHPSIEVLPKVNGITVNTTHGNEASIERVFNRFHPMVESMEGAAFMFACQHAKIPFVQIRSVSNFVEKRNKENWNIPLAIENLNKKVIEIIKEFK